MGDNRISTVTDVCAGTRVIFARKFQIHQVFALATLAPRNTFEVFLPNNQSVFSITADIGVALQGNYIRYRIIAIGLPVQYEFVCHLFRLAYHHTVKLLRPVVVHYRNRRDVFTPVGQVLPRCAIVVRSLPNKIGRSIIHLQAQ